MRAALEASSESIFNWEAKDINNGTLIMHANKLANAYTTVFKWHGLPDQENAIDPRFIERTLFSEGVCYFFYDKNLQQYMVTRGTTSMMDVYDNPVTLHAIANNAYTNVLQAGEFVPIYNNYSRSADIFNVALFARRLYEAERTIDVNISAQKTPIIFACDDDKQLNSVKQAMKKYTGNEPFMICKTSLAGSITPIETGAQYVADKIAISKRQIEAEAYSLAGINSNAAEKKERLIASEVENSTSATTANLSARLDSRLDAIDRINKMFNLKLSITVKEVPTFGDLHNNDAGHNGEIVGNERDGIREP